MATRDIIVIGGSTGSGAVLRSLFSRLPENLPASLFVVTHMPSNSSGYLAEALNGIGPMSVSEAIDGQPIERGRAYVAAPDRHLMLADGTIMLGEGARENMARPAIDPLFRSAALHYGGRAVGVVLTGMLNDGAAGLSAIKHCGGTAIVQHPLDSEADQMPIAALEAVEVDHVAPVADLPGLIATVAGSAARDSVAASESIELEVEIAMGARLGAHRLSQIAQPSAISCPDCHGVLSEMHDQNPLRFRCQIGHAYTAEILAARNDELDEAVRIALRVMEERVTLTSRMADDARTTGRSAVAELYDTRAEEYSGYAGTLRKAAIRSLRMSRVRREQDI